MTKPVLDGACVMTFVGQRVAASVAKHVRKCQEGEAGARTIVADMDGWRVP